LSRCFARGTHSPSHGPVSLSRACCTSSGSSTGLRETTLREYGPERCCHGSAKSLTSFGPRHPLLPGRHRAAPVVSRFRCNRPAGATPPLGLPYGPDTHWPKVLLGH